MNNKYKSVYQALFAGLGIFLLILVSTLGSNILLLCKGIGTHDLLMFLWGAISIFVLLGIIIYTNSSSFAKSLEGWSDDIDDIEGRERKPSSKDDIENKLND